MWLGREQHNLELLPLLVQALFLQHSPRSKSQTALVVLPSNVFAVWTSYYHQSIREGVNGDERDIARGRR